MKIKKIILSLLVFLTVGSLVGCGSYRRSSAATHSVSSNNTVKVDHSTADKCIPHLPLSSPGPLAVCSGKMTDTLDVYANNIFVVSLPYSMLNGFPAVDPWHSSSSEDPKFLDGLHVYCGSIENFVWAVLGSNSSGGIAFNSVCTSTDGGKTWRTEKTNAMYVQNLGGMATGANFVTAKTGFICFSPHGSNGSPGIARTLDGGKTWARVNIDIPATMKKYAYFTPQCPMFTGKFGVIPLICTAYSDKSDVNKMAYLITTDGGISWDWEQQAHK